MKILIIYFSQTGNTKKIASVIKKGILQNDNECKIIDIQRVNIEELRDFELIGIGTPTFFYREPPNVKKFIQNLTQVNGKHCFIFSTHGSIIGNTFYNMKNALNERGYLVVGSFDCYANSSIQFYPSPMHTAGHPDEIDLKEAEDFGMKICDISNKIHDGEISLIPKFELIKDTWWARKSENITIEFLRKNSPQFKINQEKCNKCLTCQDNCPTDAIDVEDDPPKIQKEGCIFCWFCEKACPAGAIEADWSKLSEKGKENLLRYIDVLKEAEKAGKFRPHIDYEKIR